MMTSYNCILLSLVVGSAIAYTGEFIPKSYYVIDQNGHKSDVVYFRSRRDVEMFPFLRTKRSTGSSAKSYSQASSSASSHSSSGSEPYGYQPDSNFAYGQGGYNNYGEGAGYSGYKGPILFSRFGEDKGTGVKVSGSAQGEKGAFSSSSSSIDSNGNIKYSVQSGKY